MINFRKRSRSASSDSDIDLFGRSVRNRRDVNSTPSNIKEEIEKAAEMEKQRKMYVSAVFGFVLCADCL